MRFNLTTSGKALLDANPTTLVVTRIDYGSAYGYSLPTNPTGLTGSVVHTSSVFVYPHIVDANTISYPAFLSKTVGPFSFGEAALYVGATLFGVGVSDALITKTATVGAVEGGEINLDFFCDLQPGQRINTAEQTVNSQLVLPSVPLPDLLTPPAVNEKNVYVIYSAENSEQSYLAFADPTGKWGFSNKPSVKFQGTVDSAGSLGIESLDITGSYSGVATDLVIQFVDGPQRGYCRVLTTKSDGTLMWNTPMAELPNQGDAFVVFGPQSGSTGSGGPQITFTGTLGVGNVITGTLANGTATGFQWYRGGSAISGATNIQGGTVSQYTLVSGDAGLELSLRAIGFQPSAIAGTVPSGAPTPPPPGPSDTRPRFGIGAVDAWTTGPQALLDAMSVIPGSSNGTKAGTFTLQTSTGNYGWVAVLASISGSGVQFFDGVGYGGWSGAGLPGMNFGESPNPSTSSVLFTDANNVQWRFFRQDFLNANPVASDYTIS
jgi:hypothetical protein